MEVYRPLGKPGQCSLGRVTIWQQILGADMLEKMQEKATIFFYCVAAVSGGLGGCCVAAQHMLRDAHPIRFAFVFAYGIIGVFFGVLFAAYGAFIVGELLTDVIAPAMLAGAAGALSLGTVNGTARFILKRLGVEVIVTVRRNKKDRRSNTGGGLDN